MDKTEFYPAEVRIPLEEPQLSHLLPARRLSIVQMMGTRPVGHEWERQQKMDAELFPEFEETIFGVEDGVAELKATGELTNSRVFGMLQHQFLDDLVQGVDTSQENAGMTQAEIRVLAYLDVVLPISPDDEVVDNVAGDENPRPSWFDYVTQQASRVNELIQTDDEITENVVVTPEVRVKAMREARFTRGREYLINSAKIAGLGLVALIGGEVVSNATDIETVSESTQFAAKILAGWAGFRGLVWIAGSQAAVGYEKTFARRLEFPLFDEAELKFDDIRTEIKFEQIQANKKHHPKSNLSVSEDSADYDQNTNARAVALKFLEGVETITNSDDPFKYLAKKVEEFIEEEMRGKPEELSEIYRLLDKHLPISDKDTVTPVNELTGEKTWRGFFENYIGSGKLVGK